MTGSCEHCGKTLPARAPGGLCPRCLLAEAADSPMGPSQQDAGASGLASSPRFGDFELLDKIAEGGMGVVYRARQLSLNRIVALKMIQPGRVGSPDSVLRFRAEAEAAASLHHPNVVPIHETGECDGQPFFSMDYVEGKNLAQAVHEGPLSTARAAQAVEKIAAAVQYAHEHGILHRDLKPSNVILDEAGEPHVTDFGLARRLDGASTLTLTGRVFGSPGFMAPEQASRRPGAVGVHSDVYGLGAILYNLLTGRAPFMGETVETTLAQVLERDPVPPRLLNASTPRDLETICLKCLEKDPARRYPNAQAVAEELGRFRNREPILARPLGPAGKFERWCRRKPALAGLSMGLITAVLVGTIGVLWQWRRATQTAEAERQQRARAQAGEYTANIALAQSLINSKQFDRARQILNERVREQDRGWEWGWLQRQCHQDLMTLSGVSDAFAVFSPDSRRLATGAQEAISLWDVNSGEKVRSLPMPEDAGGQAAFSPDGQQLAVPGFTNPKVWIWDVATGQLVTNLLHPSGVYYARYSPDGKHLATTCWDGYVRVFDTWDWRQVAISPPYGDELYCAEFSPDGRRIAYAGGYYRWANSINATVCIWDWLNNQLLRMPGRHQQCVTAIAWCPPDGQLLASGSWDGQVELWDSLSARELAAFESPTAISGILSIAFSPDGRWLAVAGTTFPMDVTRLQIFDVPNRRLDRELLGQSGIAISVCSSPDGRFIATAALDKSVRIWPTEARPIYLSLAGHDQTAWTVAFSPDGKFLATGSLDQTAKIWNPTNGTLLRTLVVRFPVVSLAFSSDSQRLVTVGPDNGACVWDVTLPSTISNPKSQIESTSAPTNQEPLRLQGGHTRAVIAVAWSPNDRWIATGSKDRQVILWDAATSRSNRTLRGHTGWVMTLAFSPSNQLLASGSEDQTIRLWDIESGRCLRVLTHHQGPVLSLAFSPDGALLASGAENDQVRIWDTRTWRQLPKLAASYGQAGAVAFSRPDGRRLVTVPGDRDLHGGTGRANRIAMWDVASGQELLSFLAHTNAVHSVAFSADGRQLVTTSADNTARIWTAFPWRTEDYPGHSQSSLPSRIEQFKRQFARAWSQGPPPPPPPERRLVRHYYGDLNLPPAGGKTRPLFPIPPRSPDATWQQLDLSPAYNVALNESWEAIDNAYELDHNLAALGSGLKTLNGVTFDARGIVQLRRNAPDCEQFPDRVVIPVSQRFQRLHALHGTRWIVAEEKPVAAFVLHYTDGTERELPILYGQHLRVEDVNAPLQFAFGPACSRAVVAWTGPPAPEQGGWQPRLYLAAFENPSPERAVEEIEYVSRLTQTAPFLVGLTVE
ncbi:MAG: WD40 repeat domain-containing serine/threonine protein kinase [Verrucomicrobiia bacterium]